MTQHRDLFTSLAAPFAAREVKIRTQAGRQMQYVTARTVMNRLDAVLGPENWWDDYTPLEHSVICRLTVRLPDGQVVTKVDAGGEAGMADLGDNDKSGFSDAFKRAAVKFGVGRYLYGDGVPTLLGSTETASDSQAKSPVEQDAPQSARSGSRRNEITSGRQLHQYAMTNKIDPGLSGWLLGRFRKEGYPAKIADWSPEQVAVAQPVIRARLEEVLAHRKEHATS